MNDQREVAIPTDEEIAAALEVCERATPGPWWSERRYSNGCEIIPRIKCAPDSNRECGWIADLIGAPYLGYESTLPNAAFIALARAALPRFAHALKQINGVVGNLLAMIHRDGGHYLAEHGMEKAVEDAIAKWAEMRKELDELRHQPKEKT